ncbi:hypothetical protein LINPERHAP2_LOCUS34802 [Linum perenne]
MLVGAVRRWSGGAIPRSFGGELQVALRDQKAEAKHDDIMATLAHGDRVIMTGHDPSRVITDDHHQNERRHTSDSPRRPQDILGRSYEVRRHPTNTIVYFRTLYWNASSQNPIH